MDGKHSPGPWRTADWPFTVVDDDGIKVCDVSQGTYDGRNWAERPWKSNAALIADAPALLDALAMAEQCFGAGPPTKCMDDVRALLRKHGRLR